MANRTQLNTEGTKGSIGTLASRWSKLDGSRSSILNRKRQCAELTIPSLLPPVGTTETQSLPTPYQGLGARGVNNLASKLLLALFPPNAPFFKMAIDDFTLQELTQEEGQRAKVESALNKIERAVMTEMETNAHRVSMFGALKYLVAIGDSLLYLPDAGGMKVFRLDHYCVKRDPMGQVLEIVIKEDVSMNVLPEKLRNKRLPKEELKEGKHDIDETESLYTRIIRKGKMWEVVQEVDGQVVEGSQGTYPLDECPWIPLRWSAMDGEDYGRGLVEEYLGDLRSLEALSQAIVEGSAAAAKVLFLVKPNGTTRIKTIADSNNGDIKSGNVDDVSVLQMNKFNDFKVALDCITKIEQRLSQAFLLMSSIQRNAERVTAEEIRAMASELEDALGGVYSVLSQEAQLPILKRVMALMQKNGKLPTLPNDKIKPMLSTGLEALGRGHDLQKLQTLIGILQPFGEPALADLNMPDFISRCGTAIGIDMSGLVKSPEQKAQEQQAAQQQQQQQMMMETMKSAAPQVAGAIAKEGAPQMMQQMAGNQGNQPQ